MEHVVLVVFEVQVVAVIRRGSRWCVNVGDRAGGLIEGQQGEGRGDGVGLLFLGGEGEEVLEVRDDVETTVAGARLVGFPLLLVVLEVVAGYEDRLLLN